MAPVKVEDDPVTAEYDVYITPAMAEQIYLLQYPNRPRSRAYSSQFGATPQDMRIKPKSGYLEVDVKLNTQHNFNKYMGLKWGDATRVSKELHNPTGTYGPASGLTMAKPRSVNRARDLKDHADRDASLMDDLAGFAQAERDDKVLTKQTLGGQIIRHDAAEEAGKPVYFAGTFRNHELHLTRLTGTVQLRPQFHHLDAEEERARIAVSRAQAESAGAGPAPQARALQQHVLSEEEKKDSLEFRMKSLLSAAAQEQWLRLDYVDEDTDEAFSEFSRRLFIEDMANAPHLRSNMDKDAYLDAISTPRHGGHTKKRERGAKRKEPADRDGGGNDKDAAEHAE